MKKHKLYAMIALGTVLAWSGASSAQIRTLESEFVPLVLSGEELINIDSELSTAPVDQLFLYSYHSQSSTWTMIPFQIDEQDTSGSFLVMDTDAGLDADDEITFLMQDAGDRADAAWIPNVESESFKRLAIETHDAADPSKQAWVYLFRSTSLTPDNSTDYVDYIAGPSGSAIADTIVGQTYKLGNGVNGLANYLSIPADAGGDGSNIFEQQDLEITVSFLGSELGLNETDNLASALPLTPKDGNVRIIREVSVDVILLGQTIFSGLPLTVAYYGYSSTVLGAFDIPETLPLTIVITNFRQSTNLNQNSQGMRLFTNNNSGVPIDGQPDTINPATVDGDVTWAVASGQQGTLVTLMDLPLIGDSREIFYEDDAAAGSYGNTGFVIDGVDIEGPAPLGTITYFSGALAPGDEAALGMALSARLVTSLTAMTFDEVTSVENAGARPTEFSLRQNYPNPFNPSTLIRYVIPLSVSAEAKTKITIYNLLGVEVRTLVDRAHAAGDYAVVWDGRSNSGDPVTSGLYFYRLQAGDLVQTKKMILVK